MCAAATAAATAPRQAPAPRAASVDENYSEGEWEEDDGRSFHSDDGSFCSGSGDGGGSDGSGSDEEGSEGYRKGACGLPCVSRHYPALPCCAASTVSVTCKPHGLCHWRRKTWLLLSARP